VAINDTLPLQAARHNAIVKSFWGFESELHTKPMLSGAKLMSLRACAMD